MSRRMTKLTSEDSDQPGHPSSLIRVFAVQMQKPWVLSYLLSTQRRLWSDWADAQAEPSLLWAHWSFYWFRGWSGRAIVLGSFQCRGILLLWHMACESAQSRQNLRCSLIQAVSQEEPSDRKPYPWSLWMAGHAQLKFVMTECSKTNSLDGAQTLIRLHICVSLSEP